MSKQVNVSSSSYKSKVILRWKVAWLILQMFLMQNLEELFSMKHNSPWLSLALF